MISIERIDHLVLTVRDINSTVDFYTRVLGMQKICFADNRTALSFGKNKINLHQLGKEFEPKADEVRPGSADLCFIVGQPLSEVAEHLNKEGIIIVDGPIERNGAVGKILSIYCRDPDGNLLELSSYNF